jgi:hypothetical protein
LWSASGFRTSVDPSHAESDMQPVDDAIAAAFVLVVI